MLPALVHRLDHRERVDSATDIDDKRSVTVAVAECGRVTGPSGPRPKDQYAIVNGTAAFH